MRTKIIAIGIIVMIALCTTMAIADKGGVKKTDVTTTSVADADIEIKLIDEQLNLQSNGKYVTVLIHEVVGYDLEDVTVSTVNISYNGTELATVVTGAPTYIIDCDGDGDLELMVKFDRATIIAALGLEDYVDETPDTIRCIESTITLIVSGELEDGNVFEGDDQILLVIPPNWDVSHGNK